MEDGMDAEPSGDDRMQRLDEVLDSMILKIMVNLNQRGYSSAEILAALDDVCDRRHRELEEDPDPAEDPENAQL
jgi:hypothetical protein